MRVRALAPVIGLAAFLVAAVVLMPATADAKRPKGGGGGGGFSTTSTYVKNYANVVGGVQYDLTPEDVQATPDGGAITLALTQAASPSRVGVSWLLKTSAVGAPEWQEEVGCPSTPPGDYSDESSLQLTSDGGYVLAGGTIGCGSGNDCPSTSGLACGLVERLDGAGNVEWARVYSAGVNGTEFDQIAQTNDGGFVAAGSATDANHDTGGLVVKLDALGDVEWARELGPTGTNQLFLHAVRQTSDGGYVATGELDDGSTSSYGLPLESVLAVKLDSAGDVTWLRAFNDVGSGSVTATEHAQAIVQTADGGYAIGGNWDSASGSTDCCEGALLLKLGPSGSIQFQTAYTAGVRCIENGFAVTCSAVGGVIYSVNPTPDGGYLLAGDANLELGNEAPLVPWLAKADGGGALVWQEQDYQANASTGAPLSEYFASAALTPTGPLAVGSTENYGNGLGELLGVQTDESGTVGTCSQVHTTSALSSTDPGLVDIAPDLAVATPLVSQAAAPVQTLSTTAAATAAQC